MPPKSDVWKQFTKLSKTDAKCKYCGKIVKTSGNTSNLKSHLKKHQLKDEIITLSSATKSSPKPGPTPATASTNEALTSASNSAQTSTSISDHFDTTVRPTAACSSTSFDTTIRPKAACSSTSTGAIATQTSIQESFGLIKKFAEGGSRHCNITQGLLYFVCKDGMPLSVVDGEGFRRLMKEAVPLYKVPTRNTIKTMINEKYDILSSDFKSHINCIDQFTITTDVWSNMMTTTSYLGVTIHFIDGTSIQSVGLGVNELDQSHTAEYLGSQILLALNQWDIPKEKVSCVVTDNEASMVKAVADTFGKNKHVRCLAHSINLLAESSMKKTEGLDNLIKMIREIVKFIKRSVIASDLLRKEQLIRGILEGEVLKMILDVQTRWNSTYYMVERFLDLSNIVSSILVSRPDSPPMLTAMELESAKEVKNLLSYLERLTKEFSGDTYVTGSMVIPLLNCFLESIKKSEPKLNIGVNLKSSLLNEFTERFKDREQAHLLALPMFMDPRFKNIHFMDPVSAARTLNQVKKLIATVTDNAAVPSESETEMEATATDSDDLWSHHKALALKTTQKMTASSATNSSSYLDLNSEISLYLSTPVSPCHKVKPLEVWEDYKNIYPKLYLLARKYLCVLATSVPAERLFSKAGSTVNEKRNRLSSKLLSKLIFLNGLPIKYWK